MRKQNIKLVISVFGLACVLSSCAGAPVSTPDPVVDGVVVTPEVVKESPVSEIKTIPMSGDWYWFGSPQELAKSSTDIVVGEYLDSEEMLSYPNITLDSKENPYGEGKVTASQVEQDAMPMTVSSIKVT